MRWAPRILSMAFAAFLSMLATDTLAMIEGPLLLLGLAYVFAGRRRVPQVRR